MEGRRSFDQRFPFLFQHFLWLIRSQWISRGCGGRVMWSLFKYICFQVLSATICYLRLYLDLFSIHSNHRQNWRKGTWFELLISNFNLKSHIKRISWHQSVVAFWKGLALMVQGDGWWFKSTCEDISQNRLAPIAMWSLRTRFFYSLQSTVFFLANKAT